MYSHIRKCFCLWVCLSVFQHAPEKLRAHRWGHFCDHVVSSRYSQPFRVYSFSDENKTAHWLWHWKQVFLPQGSVTPESVMLRWWRLFECIFKIGGTVRTHRKNTNGKLVDAEGQEEVSVRYGYALYIRWDISEVSARIHCPCHRRISGPLKGSASCAPDLIRSCSPYSRIFRMIMITGLTRRK